MPDSATTPPTEGVATARKPKRRFDLAETDAAATASARGDAPSLIRATTTPAAVSETAPVTPAVVARKPIAMIPLVAASAPSGSTSGSTSDTASDSASGSATETASDKTEGGCCGGGCCS